MSAPLDDVQERLEVAQQRLSASRDAVLGLAAEYDGDLADGWAAQDPRREAAQDDFSEAEWDVSRGDPDMGLGPEDAT
jgi:hypothetical protein